MNGRSPHGDGLCAKHDAVAVQCDSDVWEGGRGGDKRKTGVAVWMVLVEWVGYRNRNGGRGGALNFSGFFLGFFSYTCHTHTYVPQTAVYPLPFTLYPLRCARVKRAETGLALPNAKPTESRESLAPIRSLLSSSFLAASSMSPAVSASPIRAVDRDRDRAGVTAMATDDRLVRDDHDRGESESDKENAAVGLVPSSQPNSTQRPNNNQLSAGELKSMLGQCLKMASENKITAHNTWGLPLIEHLEDLIQEDGAVRRTNFQKASVTLDAGVKIYSYRVDSVHTETFKMLGGLGRAGGEVGGQEDAGDGLGVDGEHGRRAKKQGRRRELQPEATLEGSLEALNVKKFDLAFAVDPLFHKTSAQFDEGGAHGLLLNNLSVYKGCSIVFDSMDVPDRAVGDAVVGKTLEETVTGEDWAACVREGTEGVGGLGATPVILPQC